MTDTSTELTGFTKEYIQETYGGLAAAFQARGAIWLIPTLSRLHFW